MALICETENFIVESKDKPHVTRTDGGHIRILPKVKVSDRTKLSPKLATELMRLTMIVGEAMEKGLNNRGINVIRINYEELGNWAYKRNEEPYLHIHLYGRAKDAKMQVFPEALQLPDRSTGFYDNFEPLDEGDIVQIQKHIDIISKQNKYRDKQWGL